jgi:hypothetical protein
MRNFSRTSVTRVVASFTKEHALECMYERRKNCWECTNRSHWGRGVGRDSIPHESVTYVPRSGSEPPRLAKKNFGHWACRRACMY